MLADLHIHSVFSGDSTVTVQTIFKLAAENSLAAVAITDHDMTDAIPEGRLMAEKAGICLVPGAEVSGSFAGRMAHLLVFHDKIDEIDEIRDFLDGEVFVAKRRSVLPVLDALAAAGLPVSAKLYDEEVERGGKGGSPLDRLLQHQGVIKDNTDYNKLVEPLIPQELNRNDWGPPLKRAIEVACTCNAATILAHPGAGGVYCNFTRDELDELRQIGLDGVEVYHEQNNPEQQQFFLQYAKEHDLLITAGSDYHGRGTCSPGDPALEIPDKPLPSSIHLRDLLNNQTGSAKRENTDLR